MAWSKIGNILGPKGIKGNDGENATAQQVANAVAAYLSANPAPAGRAATVAVKAVTTLPAGSQATVSNAGTASDAQLSFGIPQGLKGDTGPSAKVSLGTYALKETMALAVTAGVRQVTFTGVTGVLAGDDILLFPVSQLPAGFALHNVVAPANERIIVTMTNPAIALLASYNIPCRVVALR